MDQEGQGRVEVRVEGEGIVGEVEIAAPVERVFRALTDPARLRAWWGARDAYWVEAWRSELVVGGVWEAHCRSARGPSRVHGRFLEIDPPRRLVYTWNPSWHEAPETTVTWELEPRGDGTLLCVRHTGFGEAHAVRDDHAGGWPAVLGWLVAYAEPAEF